MPAAPAFRASAAKSVTDGVLPSLELRMSAILLRLTESFVSMRKNQAAGKAAKPINVISTENASAAQAQSMAQRAMVERV